MADRELTIIDFAAATGNLGMFREETLASSTGANKKGNDDHLSVRHLLPKTKVSHTILHDNLSQDRLLASKKQQIDRRANRERLLVDRTKKTFMSTQVRKRGKWKREDDVRINCLNLPALRQSECIARPPSMKVLYNSPNYTSGDPDNKIYVPLRPTMGLHREKTEIVCHRDKIAVTRLPSIVRLSTAALNKYDRYRGSKFMSRNLLSTDKRFIQCENLLSRLGVRTPPKPDPIGEDSESKSVEANKGRNASRGFFFTTPSKAPSLPLQMRGVPPFHTRSSSTTKSYTTL